MKISKLANSKKLNLERCIICQNINSIRGSKKLTSTDNGRRNVINYSNTLQDNLLCDIDEHDLEHIKYHVDTCYSRYKRKCDRTNIKKSDCSASTSNSVENEEQGQETCRSSKRWRFDEKSQLLIVLFAANPNGKVTLNSIG